MVGDVQPVAAAFCSVPEGRGGAVRPSNMPHPDRDRAPLCRAGGLCAPERLGGLRPGAQGTAQLRSQHAELLQDHPAVTQNRDRNRKLLFEAGLRPAGAVGDAVGSAGARGGGRSLRAPLGDRVALGCVFLPNPLASV